MKDPLAYLVDAVGTEEFFSEYWEVAPLLNKRENSSHFDSIFSLDIFDCLLNSVYANRLDDTDVRLVHQGAMLPFSDYSRQELCTRNRVLRNFLELDRVFELYRDGATIILNRIHNMWVPLGRFVKQLEKYLGVSVNVNAYLTPPNSQGFGIHYDTHDVFAAQIFGTKRWRLYGSYMPLATPATPRDSREIAAKISGKGLADVGEQIDDFVAKSGDLVYIPRGFAHDAESTDELSLHLTIGVHASTWGEVMHAAVDALVRQNPAFRASIAPRLHENALDKACLEHVYANLLAYMKEYDVFEIVNTRLRNDPIRKKGFFDGQLSQIANTSKIVLNSLVGVRPTEIFDISETNESAIVSFCNKSIEFPIFVLPQLQSLQQHSKIRVSNLPSGLDEEGKLVLVRRLVNEGLLMVYDTN